MSAQDVLNQLALLDEMGRVRARQLKSHAQMLVNLSSLSVLPQQPPENPHPPEPHDFGGHSSFRSTLSFTVSSVSSKSLGSVEIPRSGARVHDGGFDNAATSVSKDHRRPTKLTCDHL